MSTTAVLTASPALPARSALEAAARALDVELSWKESASGLSLGLCGATVHVRAVSGPVPNAEADTAAFLSLSAVSGKWRLGSHAAHLQLSLEGPMQRKAEGLRNRLAGTVREASPLERLSLYTRAVAAVSQAVNGLGVHWAAGPVTHAPDFFAQMAKETPLPLPLWLGVSLTPEPGGRTTVLSFGMKQLGLPDLLLAGPGGKELPDTVDFFFSALASIAERGRAPEEGETIPRSLLSRPKVRYTASPLESGVQVWKLEL
jgi:hypothetical protein